eukprot:992639-Prymnesium_polylepis.1
MHRNLRSGAGANVAPGDCVDCGERPAGAVDVTPLACPPRITEFAPSVCTTSRPVACCAHPIRQPPLVLQAASDMPSATFRCPETVSALEELLSSPAREEALFKTMMPPKPDAKAMRRAAENAGLPHADDCIRAVEELESCPESERRSRCEDVHKLCGEIRRAVRDNLNIMACWTPAVGAPLRKAPEGVDEKTWQQLQAERHGGAEELCALLQTATSRA